MTNTASLLWSVLFSSVGLGYFVYGKKQGRGIPLLSGVVLMAFPYFVSNAFLMVLIGAVFIALPFVVRY
jgi:hypothetical protein